MSGDSKVFFDQAIFLSEKEQGKNNFALAYYLKARGSFDTHSIEETLDFDFQICSININCKVLSNIASTYCKFFFNFKANYGISPISQKKCLSKNTVKRTMQVIYFILLIN
jgi:glutaminase